MRKYHPTGAQPRIPVWGPAGTAERMARAYDLPLDPGMTEEFDFRVTTDSSRSARSASRRARSCTPSPRSRSRVTADGRTLVYSGDTGPCEALDDAAAGAHLLLAEASFRSVDDNPPDLHMTGADCGRTAARAGVERLVLTHVPPWHDPVDAEAEAQVRVVGTGRAGAGRRDVRGLRRARAGHRRRAVRAGAVAGVADADAPALPGPARAR